MAAWRGNRSVAKKPEGNQSGTATGTAIGSESSVGRSAQWR